jgi:hypothetical protein
MEHAVDMGSCGMIHILCSIKITTGVHAILRFCVKYLGD